MHAFFGVCELPSAINVLLYEVMQVRANRNLSSNLIGQDASSMAALGQPLAIYGTMAHEKPNGPKYASSNVWVFCLC